MTATLTDEQRAIQDVARRFATDRIAPGFMPREQQQKIDRVLIREMGALGLIGVDLPERYGGLGAASVTAGVVIEAIGYADLNVAYVQLLASLNGQIIARHAPPALAETWIPRIVSGDALCALALTEPRGGSDAANLVLSARRAGDSYVLNGEKSSISMADQADIAVVFARTGASGSGARGVSAFLVPMDSPGVSTTRFNDLGSKAVGRGSIFFDNVEVPAGHLLSAEGMGFVQVMQGFDYSR
ncbi:MAG: cyclohexanecarboxyl-CoA dehydrogenase, partial [Acetobacteraceae bacterium]|nr:cyclohexanecarboxyl-CoA dehydrogenase [Acetobacteraceae bacterium]